MKSACSSYPAKAKCQSEGGRLIPEIAVALSYKCTQVIPGPNRGQWHLYILEGT